MVKFRSPTFNWRDQSILSSKQIFAGRVGGSFVLGEGKRALSSLWEGDSGVIIFFLVSQEGPESSVHCTDQGAVPAPWVRVPALSWEALLFLNLPRLDERRSELCVNIFKKISKGGYSLKNFRPKSRICVHHHYTRSTENYMTMPKCRTERLLRSFFPSKILTLNNWVCIDHNSCMYDSFLFTVGPNHHQMAYQNVTISNNLK